MATQKSIVQVDVDSEQFKEFMALFEKYKAMLDKMPGTWAKVDKAVVEVGEDSKKTFDQQVAALKIIQTQNQNITLNLRQQATHVGKTNRTLSNTARVTKSIAKNVANTTWHLLKWAALGGLAGAAGGFWGLDKLAGSATNVRTTSRNLGASPGELRAAQVNYGSYFNAEGALGRINDVQSSLSSSWLLSGMGLDTNQSAGQLLPQLIPKLLERYKLAGGKREIYEAQGLGQLMDFNEIRSLSRLPAGEVGRMGAQYGKDVGALGMGDQTLSAWQRLSQQFDRAGVQIQNTLISGLVRLTPHLEAFSRGIVSMVEGFANNPKMGEWINSFGAGLQSAAAYLGSEEFKVKAGNFLSALNAMATGMLKVARFLGIAPEAAAAFTGGASGSWGSPDSNPGVSVPRPPQTLGMLSKTLKLANLERQYGLPPGILMGVYGAESGFGKNEVSSAGALGPFQHMPAVSKAWGEKDPFDFAESSETTAKILKDELGRFKGDRNKAIAAYHSGAGNVNAAIAAGGANWLSHLGPEGRAYVPKVNIIIQNQTGGSAVVTASQLPK